ncbi:hypothetical protein FM21_03795 [Streptomyces mutabilis]|uniref:RDD domain-containing protein n=1 Tax=Streptomyces mutabilis TaxID=67332 RepID=A0A086N2B5_9ACTN|nr:hypothetical protein FM21_03795 [Streptomyces mutabilis]
MPGTSRPAPEDGEPLAPPPGVRPSVEETGPHFFDEDPVEDPPHAAASQHGSRPEPAASWGAGRSDRSGSVDAHGSVVTWPGPARATDPRVAHAQGAEPAGGAVADAGDGSAGPSGARGGVPGAGVGAADGAPVGSGAGGDPAGVAAGGAAAAGGDGAARNDDAGTARADTPARSASGGEAEAGSGSTFVFGRPAAGPGARAGRPSNDTAEDEGTITFRAVSPRGGGTEGPGSGAGKAAARAAAPQAPAPTAPSGPQPPAGPPVPHQAAAPQAAAPRPVASPPQPAASGPVAAGPGGGQSSWAQQVHRLAGAGEGEQPVAPWKPPVEDVFQAAARRQAAARPAGLGKRLAARLIDTVVLGGVTAVAAVPLGIKAVDHVNGKIDEAKLSGETVTVWLLDGTTSTYLGIVLAVLLLFGVVYEALPTAKWGRTLGKKLLGLEVRDIEAHEPPSFGAALRRWLVCSVPGVLVIGLVGVVWCLFDRPWHQCWHDKAANTFVAG